MRVARHLILVYCGSEAVEVGAGALRRVRRGQRARETGAAGGHLGSATVQPDRQPSYLDMTGPYFRFDNLVLSFVLLARVRRRREIS